MLDPSAGQSDKESVRKKALSESDPFFSCPPWLQVQGRGMKSVCEAPVSIASSVVGGKKGVWQKKQEEKEALSAFPSRLGHLTNTASEARDVQDTLSTPVAEKERVGSAQTAHKEAISCLFPILLVAFFVHSA